MCIFPMHIYGTAPASEFDFFFCKSSKVTGANLRVMIIATILAICTKKLLKGKGGKTIGAEEEKRETFVGWGAGLVCL